MNKALVSKPMTLPVPVGSLDNYIQAVNALPALSWLRVCACVATWMPPGNW